MKDYLIESMTSYMDKMEKSIPQRKNLNESFVMEWWGQTEESPSVLKKYGITFTPLKKRNDEVLYKFYGSHDAIRDAMSDGYFYSLQIGEDDGHSDDLDESLTEARNPENDEVNSIIKKHLGKKSRISKKEQEVLDKYGISRDEYGRFKGKNGELLSKSGTTVYGPRNTNRYASHRSWNLSKGYNNHNYQKTADSFDNVDFANYLNKDHRDTTAADRSIYNRRKNKWGDDYDATQAENDALRPYSDKYNSLKDDERRDKRWLDFNKKEYPYDSDEDIEKKVSEYKQKLLQDRIYNKQRVDRSQAVYDKTAKELNDFRDSIKAKQAAKKKNEALSLKEDYSKEDILSYIETLIDIWSEVYEDVRVGDYDAIEYKIDDIESNEYAVMRFLKSFIK